jgi:hypothetical protein
VSTDLPIPPASSGPGRAPGASACEPFRDLILAARAQGRNAKAIWQDLVDDHGFTARVLANQGLWKDLLQCQGHVRRPAVGAGPS